MSQAKDMYPHKNHTAAAHGCCLQSIKVVWMALREKSDMLNFASSLNLNIRL